MWVGICLAVRSIKTRIETSASCASTDSAVNDKSSKTRMRWKGQMSVVKNVNARTLSKNMRKMA